MKRNYLYLLALPIIYLAFEYFKFPLLTHYYSTNPDPTYIYLMNGLNVADGNWELGHYDNPGTPLHLLTGLLLWIIHLFSGHGEIVNDVKMNPEFYIQKCVAVLFFLKAFTLYFVGFKITNVTKNVIVGLGFQLIPLFIIERLRCPGLIHPDILLDILCLLFVAYLFPVLYRKDSPTKFKKIVWYIAPLSMIVGAMAATKISSVGLVFVPLLIFAGWRSKAFYVILSVGFFYFFTLPINSKLGDFFNFVLGIATHKGHYGSGEAGFITLSEFVSNIYQLYSKELTLAFTFVISLIGGVYFSLRRNNIWGFLLMGIAIAYIFQTIIIGKHYSYHYALPMHYVFVLSLFALAKLLKDRSYFDWARNRKSIFLLGLSVFLSVGVIRAFNQKILAPYESAKMLPTDTFLVNRKQPTLFFPGKDNNFITSSYVQPALWFGKFYSGYITRWDRANELEEEYPSSYFYNTSYDKVEDWNTVLPFWMICKRHPLIDIYVRDKSNYDIEKFISNQIEIGLWPQMALILNKIFENSESGEVIYQLKIDNEWFLANYVTAYSKELTFDKEQNKEIFVPGKNSEQIKLHEIDVVPGDFITASIWRKSSSKICFIELRGNNGFYDHTGYITGRKGDWERITITHEVPPDYQGKLDITVRNATRNDASFDNLEVSIVRRKIPTTE